MEIARPRVRAVSHVETLNEADAVRNADAYAGARTPEALLVRLGNWVRLALGIASVGYVVAWIAFRRRSERGKTAGIVILSLATMLTMQAVYTGSDIFRATRSAADIVTRLENASNPPYDRSAPFFQVRMYDQTLPFYLERTTTLVEYRDELGILPEALLNYLALLGWSIAADRDIFDLEEMVDAFQAAARAAGLKTKRRLGVLLRGLPRPAAEAAEPRRPRQGFGGHRRG